MWTIQSKMSSEMNDSHRYIRSNHGRYNEIPASIIGLFLPVIEDNGLYTFLGDTVLQAEPMKINHPEANRMNKNDKALFCSAVELKGELEDSDILGNLIPLGGTSTLHQKYSYSVMDTDHLKQISNCYPTIENANNNEEEVGCSATMIDEIFLDLLYRMTQLLKKTREGNKHWNDDECFTEMASTILHMFNSHSIIDRTQYNSIKESFEDNVSPWLHLYRVMRISKLRVIFHSDNISGLYQYVFNIANLQFSPNDIPALKATSDPNSLYNSSNDDDLFLIQVTKIKSKKDYDNIVHQSRSQNTEKCIVLFGVRGYV